MIAVYSTYSQDKISKGNRQIVRPGGPLLFIENALKDLSVSYKTFFGKTVDVEIKVHKNGEVGRITTTPKKQIIPSIPSFDFVVVSTIFDEWDMSELDVPKNKVFIDIQGYVRDAREIGKKKVWKSISHYSKKIYCLKGTKEEMQYLPKNIFDEQKKRLLVITDGKKGIIYYFKGREYEVSASKRIEASETIGVGDTFLGYLVGYICKGRSVDISIKNAIKKTELFLESKTGI